MDQNICSVSVLEWNFLPLVDFCFDFQHCVRTWIKIFTTQQISMKKLFLENWSCWKTRSQRIIYLVNFHRKNAKASFLCLLAKVVPGKVLFIDKKFLDQNFGEKISFWILFSVQRVIFWIKTSKRVRLRAIFYNSTTFESIILDVSDFEQTSFTTDPTSEWYWFVKKSDFDEYFACRKSFLELFITENSNFCCYLLSQKPSYGEKMDKNQFWRKTFENNQILKQVFTTRQTLNQEFQIMSGFQSTLNNSSFLESDFLQHVKFWNIFFTTHQILTRNFNNATGFYVKLVLENEILLDNLLSENLSKKVSIQANHKRLVSFWNRTFAACQFLNQTSYLLSISALTLSIASELEPRSLQPIRFRWKTFFRKLKLLENSLSKNHLFDQFSPCKPQSKFFCASLPNVFRKSPF